MRKLFLRLYKYQLLRKYILKQVFWFYKYHNIHKRKLVRNEFQDIKNILQKDNPIIIDGGANVGLYSMFLKMYFPNATIYCFEPQDIGTGKNLSMFNDVMVYRYALGNENKIVDFRVSSNSEASTLMQPKVESTKEISKVRMTTLDDWAKNNNVQTVDLLKLDLEGYDYYALQGASGLLKRTKLVFAEVTFGDSHWYNKVPTFFDIQQLLGESGFTFVNFYDVASDDTGRLKTCNALFRRY